MELPIFACSNLKISDKNSIAMSKCSKEETQKSEKICTSSNLNDNSTDNLEIIDYPYPSNINSNIQDLSFINNASEIQIKEDDNNEVINNESYMRLQELIEDNLNKSISSKQKNSICSSSVVINNEDSITENKIILKKLIINHNNKTENRNNDDKIKKNKYNKNTTVKKTAKKAKKLLEIKIDNDYSLTDRYTQKNNLFQNRVINTQRINVKKIKRTNFFLNSQITRNKTNNLNGNNTSNSNNKRKNAKNKLYFESFSKNKRKNDSLSYKDKSKVINNNRKISKIFKEKINEINRKNIDSKNKTDIQMKHSIEKILNNSKKNNKYNKLSIKKKKTNSSSFTSNCPFAFSNDYYKKILLSKINKIDYNFLNNENINYQNKQKNNGINVKKIKKKSSILKARIKYNPFDIEKKTIKNISIMSHIKARSNL